MGKKTRYSDAELEEFRAIIQEKLDKAYKDGVFEKVFTTNGVYQPPELLEREWYQSVELSKYVAYFLDTLNHDLSVSTLLDSSGKIDALLRKKGLK